MKQQFFYMRKTILSIVVATTTAGFLSACALGGGLSQVDANGKTDQPVFPDLSKVHMDQHEGIYVRKETIALLRSGMSRDQLYALLGRPHFSEGFHVREWDYVLYINGSGAPKTCQLKVLFDKELKAQNYYWLPTDCLK